MASARPHRAPFTRWLGVLGFVATLVSSFGAQAQGWSRSLGRAIGGARDAHYRPAPQRVELQRRFRRSTTAPGPGFLFTLRAGTTNVGYMDAEHYRSVRDIGLQLIRQYNPANHFFVGIGRSPAALVTFLRLLNDSMAMTLPASDMRLDIDPSWKTEYFEHFRQLIPADIVQSNRTIVLFDRSRAGSGLSLQRLAGYLTEWLTAQGSQARVTAVGLSPQGPLVPGVTHVDTSAHPRLFLYMQRKFDHDEQVAPFLGKHRIGVNAVDDLQENPNHDRLRDSIRDRMRADAELDGVLHAEFPTREGGDPDDP